MSHIYRFLYLVWISLAVALLLVLMDLKNVHADELTHIQLAITQSALENGIDPNLALAIAEVESQFNPSMVGALGEVGVFQLRPQFHSVVQGDVKQNIDTAMVYLARLKHRCRRYGDAFFVCYNYGPSRRLARPNEVPYYRKVKAAQLRRQGLSNVANNTN